MPSRAAVRGVARTGRRDRPKARPSEARVPEASPIMQLQRAIGNAKVQRLIQRYAVPANLACDDVADWLSSNSPYAPEWAETRSTYTFNGQARVSFKTLPDGSIEAHVLGHNGLSVSVSSPVDRPQWNPSRRPNRDAVVAAWQSMRATLDAHENQHRKIAERERLRVQGEFRSLDFTVTGADRAAASAAAGAEMQSRQAQWQADSQAAQDAIDPFRGAVLTCPAPANP
jgi:predicted secreted Zn-dependent protease